MSSFSPAEPQASVVIPALNEATYLPDTLTSLAQQETNVPFEVIVVDGDSTEDTPAIAREAGARVIHGPGEGIGAARNRGGAIARAPWLGFLDADTQVSADYIEQIISFLKDKDLIAGSSRCPMPGLRSTVISGVINQVFPRLSAPILPGFNFWIDREVHTNLGGFPNIPNEDTAFSRIVGQHGPVAYHPDTLVETSARRIERQGSPARSFIIWVSTGNAYDGCADRLGELREFVLGIRKFEDIFPAESESLDGTLLSQVSGDLTGLCRRPI